MRTLYFRGQRLLSAAVLILSISIFIQGTFLKLVQAGEGTKLITGAGATFPYPMYSKWFFEYHKLNPSVEINYQSIGSGAGIKQLTARTVDFGASDAAMTDAELKAASTPILHIPTVLGAVVFAYNMKDLGKPLKLTSDVVTGIYMGKITKWNDEAIIALNPGIKLPSKAIAVTYRADSSGTTAVLTEYLAEVSTDWKSKVGAGKAIKWPVGVGQKGNEGVTRFIKDTPGAIGYVELSFAQKEKLEMAELKNKSGNFIAPTLKAVTEAAIGTVKSMPEDLRASIINSNAKNAYPISAYTYILVYKAMDKEKGKEIVNFLNWAMNDGQKMVEAEFYSPVPKEVSTKVQAKLKTIELK